MTLFDSPSKGRRPLICVTVNGGLGAAVNWRKKMGKWAFRIIMSVFIWTVWMHIASISEPNLSESWPSDQFHRKLAINSTINSFIDEHNALASTPVLLSERKYKSNGYLTMHCNGGLNQMRAGICDMIAIARYLNLTFVIPDLDKGSFWADNSTFEDIFDVYHFIDSLKDEVKIIKTLPDSVVSKIDENKIKVHSMQPISWSNETYYIEKILPLVRKHKVLHFEKTDNRLANNNLPIEMQKLRCRVNYQSLRFAPNIRTLGEKIIAMLRSNKHFVVLHLRYEMDMLAFSGCSRGCTPEEKAELDYKRENIPWWKEKKIDSEKKRLEGGCPLTPEETTLVLKALGFDENTVIYVAAGTIYDGKRRMANLRDAFPNIVKKEMLLSSRELAPIRNHTNQMAALDYIVALESDVFIPTYDGNMAKVIEGHRRYSDFRKSIILDRKELVERLDLYESGKISWDQFSFSVRESHKDRWGQPTIRTVIPGKPKVEDYFYANPQECLVSEDFAATL